jgi:phosphatidate cytidylyltransferase
MLRQRVITAVVLLAVLLPALFAPVAWPFAALTLLAIAAAGWEWGRLNGSTGFVPWLIGALVAGACLAAWSLGWIHDAPPAVWWLALLIWVLGGVWMLKAGVGGWPTVPQGLRLVIGGLALVLAWLALASARADGVNFILSLFCLVWAADIAAYFGGRRFGQRKLAPTISPGKSWEGVYSGMLAVVLLGLAWWWADARWAMGDSASFFSLLVERRGWWLAALVCVFLAAMSVVGDLVESLVKRAAGAKDSSRLLPGHGGVLDRIDALLPVFPLALALKSW